MFLMPALPPPMLFSVPPQKFRRTRTLPKEITSAKVSDFLAGLGWKLEHRLAEGQRVLQ